MKGGFRLLEELRVGGVRVQVAQSVQVARVGHVGQRLGLKNLCGSADVAILQVVLDALCHLVLVGNGTAAAPGSLCGGGRGVLVLVFIVEPQPLRDAVQARQNSAPARARGAVIGQDAGGQGSNNLQRGSELCCPRGAHAVVERVYHGLHGTGRRLAPLGMATCGRALWDGSAFRAGALLTIRRRSGSRASTSAAVAVASVDAAATAGRARGLRST